MLKNLLILVLAFSSPALFAAEESGQDGGNACTENLQKGRAKFKVIPSPRALDDAKMYEEYVKELTEPGGVLDKLGIEMTGQVVEFLQPRDLNAMTSGSAGGYPVSHYLDGAAVLQSLNPRSGFALEVVYPGPRYQHGFYRDDNPKNQQISIIDHVVGHNSFAFTSKLTHYRYGQGLEATRELDEVLTKAYEHYDKDEVQRFYLWAQTVARLWDFYAPFLEHSSEFEPRQRLPSRDALGRHVKTNRHPQRVTENVMAAFAANLPVDAPGWKKEILELLITGFSFRPALVHTQIMNEGWASIMQEIIPKHTKSNHNFSFWLDASRVMQTEAVPNLKDPYSLGVACWRRIRERLWQEPRFRGASALEKDREFIKYATDLIGTMTDEEFLRFAMDQTFVDRFNLAVVKRLDDRREWTDIGQPPSPEQNSQWRIVSKDAPRVAQMVIDRVLKPKYFFNPRVQLVDFNRPGSGEVELILDDEVGMNVPIYPQTIAPSLYAMANVIEKPVSLVVSLRDSAAKVEEPDDNDPWGGQNPFMRWQPTPPKPKKASPLMRARVVVGPNGDVKVYRIVDERAFEQIANLPDEKRNLAEVLDPNLTGQMNYILLAYLEDLYLEDEAKYESVLEGSPYLRELRNMLLQKNIESQPYDGFVTQSPNSAGALMEYKAMVERRLARALERAAQSKNGFKLGPRGISVKVLPSESHLVFDRGYLDELKEELKGQKIGVTSKIDGLNLNRTIPAVPEVNEGASDVLARPGVPLNPDEIDGGGVAPIPGEEGDNFWGPGQGEGNGRGNQPGDDSQDPSYVEIPDDMYQQFLGERVKLPKLNKKPGMSKTKAKRQGGKIRRKQGVMLADEVLLNALKRGVGGAQSEDVDPFDDLGQTLGMGFGMLQPRDIVVKSKVPTKRPDVKAAIVFIRDASASTMKFNEAFRRFVFDLKSVIRANYPGLEYRFVVFDGTGREVTEDEFFKISVLGGTSYEAGLVEGHRVHKENFPRHQYDRFTFLLGDMEDFGDSAMENIREILEDSEYFGAIAGLNSPGNEDPLFQAIKAEAASNDAIGHTTLDDDGGYRINHIKEVLRNSDEEE